MRSRRTLPALLFFALALVGAGLPLASPPSGEITPPRPPEPKLPERLLPAALARALGDKAFAGADVSLHVVTLGGSETIASLEPRRPMLPASTMKLVTGACALRELGPAHRARTGFFALAPPLAGGVLEGDLYVVAGGDPRLRVEDLWVALRALAVRGLARVEGRVVVDASLFEGPARPASWPARRVVDPYDTDQGALALGYNATELWVRAGAEPGAPALVETFPVPGVLDVVNEVVTGSRTRVQTILHAPEGERAKLTLRGRVAPGRPFREWVRLGDPLASTLGALRALFDAAGIELAGEVVAGSLPEEAQALHVHEGASLREAVNGLNKYSSNFTAEMIVRLLGAEALGGPASHDVGLQRLRACLDALVEAGDESVVADGSGYSRDNRLSAHALSSLIARVLEEPSIAPELLSSLPRAGEDGSLARRMPELAGRVRAKTGSLRDVAALAGILHFADGTPAAFAILINGREGQRVWHQSPDLLVRALASLTLEEARRATPR